MNLTVQDRNVYVMSDIHNDADGFKRMLEQIAFTDEDILIIDGDIFDRGDNPVDLYFAVSGRKNIYCVRGNHDEWVRREIIRRLTGKDMGEYISYNTYPLLEQRLTEVDMLGLAEWIGTLPYYIEISVDGQLFQIAHAQTFPRPSMIFNKSKLYMGDAHYEAFLTGGYELDGVVSVVGHTATEDGRIWTSPSGYLIRTDCGNGYQCYGTGRLGAIRLNDRKEYYYQRYSM